jgi:hypothetical protein
VAGHHTSDPKDPAPRSRPEKKPSTRAATSTPELDFRAKHGPAVTPRQIAAATGMSHRFVLEDIELGQLKAINVGRGKRPVYRIPFREAKRYVKRMGGI